MEELKPILGDDKPFMARLMLAQNEIKVGKSQFNRFGNYNFRNCEDIMEAAKPVCAKYDIMFTVTDDIVLIGNRFYVKATATAYDVRSDLTHSVTSFAREAESKKGMDDSQVTGASTSYARKYALGGLFDLDDSKDADSDDNRDEPGKSANKSRGSRGPNNAPAAPKPPESPTLEGEEMKCADCGRPFTNWTSPDGKRYTALALYNKAKNLAPDGKARCKKCRERYALLHEAELQEMGESFPYAND